MTRSLSLSSLLSLDFVGQAFRDLFLFFIMTILPLSLTFIILPLLLILCLIFSTSFFGGELSNSFKTEVDDYFLLWREILLAGLCSFIGPLLARY